MPDSRSPVESKWPEASLKSAAPDYDTMLETPALYRKRDRAAQVEALTNCGVDNYDIPAFLRKQADWCRGARGGIPASPWGCGLFRCWRLLFLIGHPFPKRIEHADRR